MTLVVLVLALGACGSSETLDAAPSTAPATTQATSTSPRSSAPAQVRDEFPRRCVDYTLVSAFLGDVESQTRWNGAGQDEAQLREHCTAIAADALARSDLERNIEQLDAFFAAADAEQERQERELAAAKAEEDRKLRDFYRAVERAEEQRKVDEYLRAVAEANAAQEREAKRQGDQLVDRMCGGAGGWYWYEINPVRVWLDRCNYRSGGGGGGGNGGDLDCEDIGYEHEIDPWDDPNNLDGDGDGIACEGW